MVRAFDDGAPIGGTVAAGARATDETEEGLLGSGWNEYDVAAVNPAFDPTAYQDPRPSGVSARSSQGGPGPGLQEIIDTEGDEITWEGSEGWDDEAREAEYDDRGAPEKPEDEGEALVERRAGMEWQAVQRAHREAGPEAAWEAEDDTLLEHSQLDDPDPDAPAAAYPSGTRGNQGGVAGEAPPARSAAKSYARKAIQGLVNDEELLADIDAILGSNSAARRPHAPEAAHEMALSAGVQAQHQTPAPRAPARRGAAAPARSPAANNPPASGGPPEPSQPEEAANPGPPAENRHAIFDKIAENMRFASAYDLGSVELSNRFDRFDRTQRRTVPARAAKSEGKARAMQDPQPAHPRTSLDPPTEEASAAQPAAGAQVRPAPIPESLPPAWPPRPTDLRPYSANERARMFGEFEYEPDPSRMGGDGIRILGNWAEENLVRVEIPQLEGKTMGGRPMSDPAIVFHRRGREALVAMWAEWERAGLLDRILTYNGGHTPRFIRHTEGRDPRPLSNHAWGTAFDINAAWNRFGATPALVGQQGSVRELVQIANQHGFFWGGHFRRRPDGMHFELGKRL